MYTTKKAVFATFTLTTVGVTTFLLSNKNRRGKILNRVKDVYYQVKGSLKNKTNNDPNLSTKIGHPHPHDHGDNNMVSEGAMYSVNYYNVQKDEKHK